MNELHEINEKVLNGELNPLEAYISLKRTEKLFKDVLKAVQEQAIDEADNYPEKTFKAFGATIEKKSAAGRWDFSELKDWQELTDKKKELEETYKMAFKSNQSGASLVDNDTGEVSDLPQYTPGKQTIAIKL